MLARTRYRSGLLGEMLYDHGSGEVADFVAIDIAANEQTVSLYHCKGSGAPKAGARIADLYEVAGQVAKCVHWIARMAQLVARLRERTTAKPWRLLRGDQLAIKSFNDTMRSRRTKYRIILVQPGLSASKLNPQLAEVLGAADAYVRHLDCAPLEVISSP
jgi:hypothetical protein